MAEKKIQVDLVVDGDITAVEANFLSVNFDTVTTPPAHIEGHMHWSSDDGTVSIGMPNDVELQVGQESFFYVKNQSGSTMTDGTPVMFNGSVGASGRIVVEEAIADGTFPSETIVGILTQDILNGEDGFSTWFGKVRGIQTNGGNYSETWVVGDILYVSPTTAGALTNIQPSAPDLVISVAVVVVAHATTGTLLVRPTWTPNIEDLSNVNGTTPLDDYVLAYDIGNGYWDATAITESMISDLGDYVDTVNATSPIIASITGGNTLNISHSTAIGNKHIPSGGSSGQFLGWVSSGTASWQTPPNDNFYLTGLSFNTGNGILTATVSGASNPTVDLDGRYSLTDTTYTASNGLLMSGTDVRVDYVGTNNIIDTATDLEGTPITTADTIIYHDAGDNNVKKGLVGDLPFTDGTGLEYITETDSGWRLIGWNAAHYTDIGSNAVDLSFSNTPSSDYGAGGLYSFAAGGFVEASGQYSAAFGGSTIASGAESFAAGIFSEASGNFSFAVGIDTIANNDAAIAFGQFNSSSQTVGKETLFALGNGVSDVSRSNIFEITADGLVFAHDAVIADIDSAIDEVLVTKGWIDDQGFGAGSGTVTSVASGNGMDFTTITTTGTVTMGTPSAVSGVTGSSASGTTHTHAVTTGAVANGSFSLVNANGVYDFVIAQGYSTQTLTASEGVTLVSSDVQMNILNLTNALDGVNVAGDSIMYYDLSQTRHVHALMSEVNLSVFKNDAAWTSNTGDMDDFILTADSGTNQTVNDGETIDIAGGTWMNTVVGATNTVTVNHADGGAGSGTYGSTSNSTKIDQITVDAQGHITAITTGATGSGSMTSWNVQANGGTASAVSNAEEVNFINGVGTLAAHVNQTNPTITFNLDYVGTDSIIGSAATLSGTMGTGDYILWSHTSDANTVKKTLVESIDLAEMDNSENWNNYSHPNHTGHVTSTGDGATVLTVSAITGQTAGTTMTGTDEFLYSDGGVIKRVDMNRFIVGQSSSLTSGLLGTDELLISDGGTIKKMDVSVMNAYFNSNLSFGSGDGIVESLTTTGTSGAATLISGVLNIPNYATGSSPNDATITLAMGNGGTGGGNFTTDQAGNETITFNVVGGSGLTVDSGSVDVDYGTGGDNIIEAAFNQNGAIPTGSPVTADSILVADNSNGALIHEVTFANIDLSTMNNDSGFGTMTSWDFYVGGVFKEAITNGENMDFAAGNGLKVAGTTVTNPTCTYSLDLTSVNAWTGQQYFEADVDTTNTGTLSWNLNTQQVNILTLTGNCTLSAPTNQQAGATYILILKQDGTGSRTMTWNSVYKFPGGVDPTLTTTASAVDIVTFVSDGTNMYGTTAQDFS